MTQQLHFWVYTKKELKTRPQTICVSHVHSSIIQSNQQVSAIHCPSMDERRNKMQSIHTMEHHSALKRKEILTHAATWMNPAS